MFLYCIGHTAGSSYADSINFTRRMKYKSRIAPSQHFSNSGTYYCGQSATFYEREKTHTMIGYTV